MTLGPLGHSETGGDSASCWKEVEDNYMMVPLINGIQMTETHQFICSQRANYLRLCENSVCYLRMGGKKHKTWLMNVVWLYTAAVL